MLHQIPSPCNQKGDVTQRCQQRQRNSAMKSSPPLASSCPPRTVTQHTPIEEESQIF